MHSLYQSLRSARRPADIRDDDWFFLADVVFQHEGVIDSLCCHDAHQEVVAEALGHLSAVTALAQQLLETRREWVMLALSHGATFGQIAAATRLDGITARPETAAGNIDWRTWASRTHECAGCGHDFRLHMAQVWGGQVRTR